MSKAEELYEKACTGGDFLACRALGDLFDTEGVFRSKNPTEAVASYKKACDGGDNISCITLGYHYEKGDDDLTQDPAQAVVLFKRACDLNVQECFHVANFYEEAHGGLSKDLAQAVSFYTVMTPLRGVSGRTNLAKLAIRNCG